MILYSQERDKRAGFSSDRSPELRRNLHRWSGTQTRSSDESGVSSSLSSSLLRRSVGDSSGSSCDSQLILSSADIHVSGGKARLEVTRQRARVVRSPRRKWIGELH